MTRPLGQCHYCGKTVEAHHTAVERVSGWYEHRAKGLHGLKDMKREGQVAHLTCLDRSLHKDQASLFGQAA